VDGGPSVCHYGDSHEEQAFCTRAHVTPGIRAVIAGNNSRSSGAPCQDSGYRACSGDGVFGRPNHPPHEVMVQVVIKLDLRRIENSSQFAGSENPGAMQCCIP
jgi:hypothetical protein